MDKFKKILSEKISGPWFLEEDKLIEIDKIINDEFVRIKKLNEKEIKVEIFQTKKSLETEYSGELFQKFLKDREKSIRESFKFRNSKSISVKLKKNRSLNVDTFEEALQNADLKNEIPIGFEVELSAGNNKSKIEIDQFIGQLKIEVSPNNESNRDAFYKIQRWFDQYKPNYFLRNWSIIYLITIFMSLVFGLLLMFSLPSPKSVYVEEAKQLLQDGLTQDEQIKAIEILLALQTGNDKKMNDSYKIPSWVIFLALLYLISVIIFFFYPKSILGIGKGRDKIKNWQLWLKFLFWLYISLIGLTILAPYMSNFVFNN